MNVVAYREQTFWTRATGLRPATRCSTRPRAAIVWSCARRVSFGVDRLSLKASPRLEFKQDRFSERDTRVDTDVDAGIEYFSAEYGGDQVRA